MTGDRLVTVTGDRDCRLVTVTADRDDRLVTVTGDRDCRLVTGFGCLGRMGNSSRRCRLVSFPDKRGIQ